MKKTLKVIIEEIEFYFDFEKVHKVMNYLNWQWHIGNEEYEIPSVKKLKEFAFELVEKAFQEKKQISNGGFSAGIDGEDIFLTFTLEEQSTELEKFY